MLANTVPPADPPADVIVVLRAEPGQQAAVARQMVRDARAELAVQPTHVFTRALSGFAARLTSRQQQTLASDPRVAEIVPDEPVVLVDTTSGATSDTDAVATASQSSASATESASPSPTPTRPRLPTPEPDAQIVPTGVQRVGRAGLAEFGFDGGDRRVDVDIAILDTGVSPHPDLNVVGGYDCTGSRISWSDGHGHGTHVAGTAAALDNGIGVVGVAPGARIWSVKVLGSNAVGKASWVVCGLDWLLGQRTSGGSQPLFEVANMSLRFAAETRPTDDGKCGWRLRDVMHRAICRVVDAGTAVVVAAGNDSRNARRYRPAAYREVITVSALSDFDGKAGALGSPADSCPAGSGFDRDDVLAEFSNYGRPIDIMAPGKCIWSTNKGGGYKAMSGTSMATPHVSGAVALYRATFPSLTIAQVRTALLSCGTFDWRLKSDEDRFPEPLLHVGRFCT